jgi:hypothetical protein
MTKQEPHRGSSLLSAGMTIVQQQAYIQQMDGMVKRLGAGIKSPDIMTLTF